ncbi:MAG: hypothetical protein Q9174_006069 [Haloplaca sp. 1 TL-2023]
MDKFPAEIWQQIIDDCDVRTAKQIRCCSKDFNDLASPRVFEEVYFSFCSIDSITKLKNVAHHPTLRLNVRRLFFLNILLDRKYADYWTWEQALDLRESYKRSERRNGGCRMAYMKAPKFIQQDDEEDDSMTMVPRQVLYKGRDPVYTMVVSRKLLKRYNQRFIELIEAQKDGLFSSSQKEKCNLVIKEFTNLKDVRIRSMDWISSLQINSYDSIAGDENTSTPIVTALQQDVLLNHPFVNSPGHINFAALFLAKALLKYNKKVQVMDFDHIQWPIEPEASINTNVKFYTQTVLQDLRTLHFKLEWNGQWNSDPPAIFGLAELVDFLSHAVTLEEAFLDFEIPIEQRIEDLNPQLPPYYIWTWNDPNVPNLTFVISRIFLPKLKRLCIQQCAFTGYAFTQFMNRHSRTLKSLEIRDLKLVGEHGWQPVMEEVAPRMSLDEVKIDHLIDGAQENHAQGLLGEPRGGNSVAFEERHRTVTDIWLEQGRLVADFLQRGGVGDYPCWPLVVPGDDKPKKHRARLDDDIF